jgi:hypothetical protein
MSDFVSIGEAAAECEVPPKDISDLIYRQKVPPEALVCIGGRHVIRRPYLSQLKALVRARQLRRREAAANG